MDVVGLCISLGLEGCARLALERSAVAFLGVSTQTSETSVVT